MESSHSLQLDLPFGEKAKLLVVDDHHDTRELLSLFFSTRGYEVITARTGKDALDLIVRIPDIDVVLLDVFIPKVGGIEVLSEIHERTPRPGVILLTALADKEVAHDAFRLGAFDYILKPVDLSQLESSVAACLCHREYRRQSWWKRILKPSA